MKKDALHLSSVKFSEMSVFKKDNVSKEVKKNLTERFLRDHLPDINSAYVASVKIKKLI